MKRMLITILILLMAGPLCADGSRDTKQAKLDAACEAAREEKLAPMRKKVIEECVANKELATRGDCELFYADYGERTGRKAPLYYDLPECVTAFDFLQGGDDAES